MQVGSLLQTEDGRVIDVDGIEKRSGQFEVYNFKVEDFHTYFVSDLGILVHNSDSCIPPITNKFPDDPLDPSGKILGEVQVVGGKPTLTNGKPIPRREVNFVITKDNHLLIGNKHTTLSDRNDVLAAGNLTIKGERIRAIDNLSGHFRPTVEEGRRFPELLKNLGLDISGANLKLYDININSNGMVDGTSLVVNTYLE